MRVKAWWVLLAASLLGAACSIVQLRPLSSVLLLTAAALWWDLIKAERKVDGMRDE